MIVVLGYTSCKDRVTVTPCTAQLRPLNIFFLISCDNLNWVCLVRCTDVQQFEGEILRWFRRGGNDVVRSQDLCPILIHIPTLVMLLDHA